MTNLAEAIMKNATTPDHIKPFANRSNALVNSIYVVDDIGKFFDRVYKYYDYDHKKIIRARNILKIEFIKEFDFWNEIEGWFLANAKEHPVYVTTLAALGDIEIPCDFILTDDNAMGVVNIGDYFVDKDYKIYRCNDSAVLEP